MENNAHRFGNTICMILIAAMMGLFVASFIGLPAYAASLGIAAVVNDEVITTHDVQERRDLVMLTSGIPVTPENQKRITPHILQTLIDEALQMQEAKRQSITISDDDVSKALDAVTLGRQPLAAGELKKILAEKGLSQRSIENQVRAQLAWQKVVQRKLRRNVSISQDEIARAQQTQAAAPGTTELRITALSVPVNGTASEAAAMKTAEDIALRLKTRTDLVAVAESYLHRTDVKFSAPVWISQDALQPALLHALHDLKPGDITPPLRVGGGIQLIQLLDRQVNKPQADNTEIAIKQISIPVPTNRDKKSIAKLKTVAEMLHAHPGDCSSETLPPTDLPATASFARTKMGALTPQQRSVINHLQVGEVSPPLPAPEFVRLVMLCEKIEPAAGNLPDADAVRQRLFAERIELEAQKHLRNLKRDAFIDVKMGDGTDARKDDGGVAQ